MSGPTVESSAALPRQTINAGLFSVRDRRLGTFVKPFPVGFVAFPLTFVNLAAPGRAKLLEVPAEAD
jgi:hypothetical protein